MRHLILKSTVAVIVLLGLFCGSQASDSPPVRERVRALIVERIQGAAASSEVLCRNEFLCGSTLVPRFYRTRKFNPAWIDEAGISIQATALLEMIRAAHLEGLTADEYHLAGIESLITEIRKTGDWQRDAHALADLDLLLTDSFLIYASHLLAGRVDPETIHSKWLAYTRKADLVELLQIALLTKSIGVTLKELRPAHEGYGMMRNALKRYRDIASRGGWHAIPDGPILQRGDVSFRVVMIRRRLTMMGDLTKTRQKLTPVFDDTLDRAVRRYQKRHGLKVDGIVGAKTLAQLNMPLTDRIRALEINLERWRWLPHHLGDRYINVNVAGFNLEVIEGDDAAISMRVVVGTNYRRTPLFTSRMTSLVINPYWNIPPTLVEEDIYPLVQKNPQYLAAQKIRIFSDWSEGAPEVDSTRVDWSRLHKGTFYYKLRQDPGPHNALGRLKFLFPNKFAVYLHDTPHRQLFKRNKRGFSSGCIRVEKPIALAVYVLNRDAEWTRARIESAVNSGQRYVVRLPEAIPVHVLYWTAWVDRDGMVHFRDDIYGRDRLLDAALREKPSSRIRP